MQLEEDAYRAMIAGATAGRTTSTKGLTQSEAMDMINNLVGLAGPWKGPGSAGDTMRKKILSRFHRMQYYTPLPPEGGTPRLDFRRIANWMLQYSYLHKPLNNYTEKELPALVSQVDAMYKSYLKNV